MLLGIFIIVDLFLSLVVYVIVLRKLIQKNKNKLLAFALTVIAPILAISIIIGIKGFVPIPSGLRDWSYSVYSPVDLCAPIKTDNFKFWENGFSRTYPLQPLYLGTYCIGVRAERWKVPLGKSGAKDLLGGVLRAEFYHKDQFIFEITTDESETSSSCLIKDNRDAFLNHASLIKFGLPLGNRYLEDVSVKLTVLKPYSKLENYSDSLLLFISINPNLPYW